MGTFHHGRKLHPELTDDLTAFRSHLEDSDDDMKPLKVWQLQGEYEKCSIN